MKFKYFKITMFCALMPAIASAQADNFTIKGKMSPSHNGEVVLLTHLVGKGVVKDSAVVTDGAFTITALTETPQLAYIRVGKVQPANNSPVYISKGTINITAADSLKYAVITGTKLAEDYVRFSAAVQPILTERAQLMAKYMALPVADKKGEDGKAITAKIGEVVKQGQAAVYAFIDNHPDSYVSLDNLEKISGANVNYALAMPHFEKLSSELKNTPAGKAFEQKLLAAKSMVVGAKALTFESTTPEGKKLSLKEVISTGKYTLIDFWASWCAPCRAENPNVVNAYSTYHQKGLNILSVSLDTKAENWKAAIAKDGMPWNHVSSLMGWKEPAAELYGIHAIPQNVLVDAKGAIVATNLRGEALIEKLKQLL